MDLLTHADGHVLGWRIGRRPGEATATRSLRSPLGTLVVTASERGVVGCRFALERDEGHGPSARDGPALAHARRAADELDEYFAGARRQFGVALDLRGTPFQIAAWRVLCEIPFGAVISYGEQAARMERPDAARAVGRANGANPIAVIVPCHRVVASTGRLHGYAGGLDRKRWLLEHEVGPLNGSALEATDGALLWAR
ncbi:MAG: methylated-DNA--[protein]-cysteine S-methyltransferase [Phycisphaerae bacterium]|nr:methylated-DNA--[protein]-cysteine S-methyltransferase [Phycisphaerae bacterium]